MLSKVRKLPADTQHVVQVASCLGNTLDLETLSLVSEKSNQELEKSLNVAVSLGLLLAVQDTRIDPSSQEATQLSFYKYVIIAVIVQCVSSTGSLRLCFMFM